MFIKNVSKEDIVDYNCGYENFVSVKAGEVVEIVDPRAAKQFLRLLSPKVEVAEKPAPKPKKVEKVKEEKKVEVKKEKPSMFKKVLKKK